MRCLTAELQDASQGGGDSEQERLYQHHSGPVTVGGTPGPPPQPSHLDFSGASLSTLVSGVSY